MRSAPGTRGRAAQTTPVPELRATSPLPPAGRDGRSRLARGWYLAGSAGSSRPGPPEPGCRAGRAGRSAGSRSPPHPGTRSLGTALPARSGRSAEGTRHGQGQPPRRLCAKRFGHARRALGKLQGYTSASRKLDTSGTASAPRPAEVGLCAPVPSPLLPSVPLQSTAACREPAEKSP